MSDLTIMHTFIWGKILPVQSLMEESEHAVCSQARVPLVQNVSGSRRELKRAQLAVVRDNQGEVS